MNRKIITNKLIEKVESDKGGILRNRVGLAENILDYFGVDYPRYDRNVTFHIKDYRYNNLEILREFIINRASEDQLILLQDIIKTGDISKLTMGEGEHSGKVFVAHLMNDKTLDREEYKDFNITVDDIHNGLREGILNSNKEPYFINKDHHTGNIPTKILTEIKNCKFFVADLTCQNNGVYYEAGYATALGKTVIYTCFKKDKDSIHFDISQTNTIYWSDDTDLAKQLKDRIVSNFK